MSLQREFLDAEAARLAIGMSVDEILQLTNPLLRAFALLHTSAKVTQPQFEELAASVNRLEAGCYGTQVQEELQLIRAASSLRALAKIEKRIERRIRGATLKGLWRELLVSEALSASGLCEEEALGA
jgi:hypothetical protein